MSQEQCKTIHIAEDNTIILTGLRTMLVLDCATGRPSISYYGPHLGKDINLAQIRLLKQRQEAPASPAIEPCLSLCPTLGSGFHGAPGILLQGEKNEWAFDPILEKISTDETGQLCIDCLDKERSIRVSHYLKLDEASDVLTAYSSLSNLSEGKVELTWLSALTVALPAWCQERTVFSGQWAGEFQMARQTIEPGLYVSENRRGRTSHDCFPGILIHDSSCQEQSGACFGFHLGWSGNHKTQVEKLTDGRLHCQLGEYLLPGEVSLDKGQTYCTPKLFISFSNSGFSALSNNFHQFVHQTRPHKFKPKVIFNTWEAMYFDYDEERLLTLVDKVSELGVERFVLDDGWFKGRSGDTAGLGDWDVDSKKFPQGLEPLIDRVKQSGMQFGLWLEPEMVNEDSDCFRAHPDWIIGCQTNTGVAFRNQWVLDISRPEVSDYLLTAIFSLLERYPIDYIKWDMNRDINQAGSSMDTKPCVHRHVNALYKMMEAVKARFPDLDIEACASGGGRVDYGILPFVERFWASDATDAKERLGIQRGFSQFFPLSMMGSHVGPAHSPITGRQLSMAFRASVSMLSQMGVELDPETLKEGERKVLIEAIALHKNYRELLGRSRLIRYDARPDVERFALVDLKGSRFLFFHAQIESDTHSIPSPWYFLGLDQNATYRLTFAWPLTLIEDPVFNALQNEQINGALLMEVGLQLPRIKPESVIIIELRKIEQ